jgi:hypothetical protein
MEGMFKQYSRLPTLLLATALLLSAAAVARAQDFAQKRSVSEPAAVFNGHIRFDGAGEGGAGADAQADAQSKSNGGRQQPQQQPTPRPTPLTGGQKVARAFRGAFLRPEPYLLSAFSAGITQLREDDQPQKENADEVGDWGSRTARNFATRATTTVFSSGFYATLFKQDPRYEPSPSRKFGRRVGHAVSRVFVTRDDDWNLEPNYSRFAGALTASALANVWERSTPDHDRIGTDATFRRFARSFLSGAVSNVVFKEFGPDIVGIFRR